MLVYYTSVALFGCRNSFCLRMAASFATVDESTPTSFDRADRRLLIKSSAGPSTPNDIRSWATTDRAKGCRQVRSAGSTGVSRAVVADWLNSSPLCVESVRVGAGAILSRARQPTQLAVSSSLRSGKWESQSLYSCDKVAHANDYGRHQDYTYGALQIRVVLYFLLYFPRC